MDFLFGIAVGIAIVALTVWIAIRRIRHQLEAVLEKAHQDFSEVKITARVEEHAGVFYLYNADTSEFLGQGSTASELIDRLGKPNLNIVVNQGEHEALSKLREAVQQKVQDV
jgi:hypothetical protein